MWIYRCMFGPLRTCAATVTMTAVCYAITKLLNWNIIQLHHRNHHQTTIFVLCNLDGSQMDALFFIFICPLKITTWFINII